MINLDFTIFDTINQKTNLTRYDLIKVAIWNAYKLNSTILKEYKAIEKYSKYVYNSSSNEFELSTPKIVYNQSMTENELSELVEYLNTFNRVSKKEICISIYPNTYINLTVTYAYNDSVYSPTQNRIYFAPYAQSNQEYWHYIDCNDGSVQKYLNPFFSGVNLQKYAYSGGVYSPTQNRIYFVPSAQSDQEYWHYINCDDGSVQSYLNPFYKGVILQGSYIGGVYSPKQNRIYFVPFLQSNQEYWHYIDCDDGSVQKYLNPFFYNVDLRQGAYAGGVYSPTQNRIYFVPYSQSIREYWYYIDCDDGSVQSYLNPFYNGVNLQPYAYNGGVYSPTQNRIYFVPHAQSDQEYWHYIDCDDGTVHSYLNPFYNGVNLQSYAYTGGVYSHTQNRIYFVPYFQADQEYWHYIDCDDGTVHSYNNINTDRSIIEGYYYGSYSPTQNRIYFSPYAQSDQTYCNYIDCDDGSVQKYIINKIDKMVQYAYVGGVYSPTQNRIYFVPYGQSDKQYWHYIDCNDGSVQKYLNPFFIGVNLQSYAYNGGVYSPTQNRIYFVPYGQADQEYWHYVDCGDGSVQSYQNINTNRPVSYAYSGGVYSPTQNRIYFVPNRQANQEYWHYINCNDGSVNKYLNITTNRPVQYAYVGGVYSPTQNRIYFVPHSQSIREYWHYIDCNDGTIKQYSNISINRPVQYAYVGGVYSPTQNRIYFVPAAQANQDYWHYIDCTDGSVQSYPNIYTNKPVYNAYNCGAYSPTQNRIYFVPYNQSTGNYFHCIDELSKFPVDRGLMASECYNKF